MFETIQFVNHGPVATVTLNRPQVRNAFNSRMIGELTEAFHDLGRREDLRVVMLRGDGHSFCAGADVEWMRASLEYSYDDNLADALRMSDMFAAIDRCPAPVIGKVHGAALGGGMGLIAVCDIVVSAGDVIFGFTEAKLGIIPAVISRFVLPRIGGGWSRALYLSGERFGPEVARQIGLVHWIVPRSELDASVDSKVNEILECGPVASRAAKRLIADVDGLSDAAMREATASRIAELRISPEGQEGLQAFLEKRHPTWRTQG